MSLRLPASAVKQLGLRPITERPQTPEPAPAPVDSDKLASAIDKLAKRETTPVKVEVQPDRGLAEAIRELRTALATVGSTQGKRPVGLDMEIERDSKNQIARVRATYIWE